MCRIMLHVATLAVLLVSPLCAEEHEGGDPLDWLRDSIPGEPGVDYPILSSPGETAFSCSGLVFGGYYADPDQGCQVFHVCLQGETDHTSFLCPNGTIFAQDRFICDWWFNVDCEASASLYPAVEGAFGGPGGGGGGGGGQCPAPARGLDCAGAVSNCWSPGQRDTDCPLNGLCCFDGCADTCVDGPKPTPRPVPQPRPTKRPSPRPQPVVFEEEEIESVVSPAVIQPTRKPPTQGPTYRPTQPSPTTYRPAFTTPRTTTSSGYSYETPDPALPSLYGPPDSGRRGRKGRRRG